MDFRSLYPSAQVRKQPVLNGILLSAASREDALLLSQRKKIKNNGVLAINSVCQRLRKSEPEEKFLVPINHYKTPPHRFEEYYACRLFAQTEIAPLLNCGYELISIAGASYAGSYTNKVPLTSNSRWECQYLWVLSWSSGYFGQPRVKPKKNDFIFLPWVGFHSIFHEQISLIADIFSMGIHLPARGQTRGQMHKKGKSMRREWGRRTNTLTSGHVGGMSWLPNYKGLIGIWLWKSKRNFLATLHRTLPRLKGVIGG